MKQLKRLILIFMSIAIIGTLSACDLFKGNSGMSAYEIAVEHGFVGTEEEWLESLKGGSGEKGESGSSGKSAYEIAVENGYGGTEEQWLDSLESTDGKSAYQIALDNGFSGTEEEWLDSLKGTDGKSAYQLAVDKGYDGTEEEWLDDLNGADGKSAYQLAVDKGYEGTEEEWLDSLNGTDGKDGKDASNLVSELYAEAKADGYAGSFSDFLTDYGSVIESFGMESNAATVSKAIKSAVIIYSRYDNTGKTESQWAAGAGVILQHEKESGNAYIVTNFHVIHDKTNDNGTGFADYIELLLYGSITPIEATVVGGEETKDIAVLKITGSDEYKSSAAAPVAVADSDKVMLGQKAIAIGNPEGEGFSATTGTVSVDSENIDMTISTGASVTYRVMRVDTAVNGGNSGGGLFNADGELIGIVNAKMKSYEIDNIAYALPTNESIAVAKNIIRNGGTYKANLLGVLVAATESKAVYDTDTGAVTIEQVVAVDTVSETGKAYGKLLAGDIILSISYDGTTKQITRVFQIGNFLIGCDGGASTLITVTVKRGTLTVPVKINLA